MASSTAAPSLLKNLAQHAVRAKPPHIHVAWRGPPSVLATVPKEPDMRLGNFEILRTMTATMANPAGNVHGGSLLEMAELAGAVVCSRHCNAHSLHTPGSLNTQSVLVRMGHVDFLKPAYLDDIVGVQAKLIYTSSHSMLAVMHVWAEDVFRLKRRLTNRAFGWYVPVTGGVEGELSSVPPWLPKADFEEELWEFGYDSYKRIKMASTEMEKEPGPFNNLNMISKLQLPVCPSLPVQLPMSSSLPPKTVDESMGQLSTMVSPEDCRYRRKVATGGMVMKMMDSAAGICAFHHCQTNIVTAAVDALDFLVPARIGNLVQVNSKITFASNKAIEIEVTATVEDLITGCKELCNKANFHFVSLDSKGKPMEVPPLLLQNEKEWVRYQEAKANYSMLKAQRQSLSSTRKH